MTREPLSVTVLGKLQFEFLLHLNRGREHDMVRTNKEYDLHIVVTSKRKGAYGNFVMIRRALYTSDKALGEADLMATDANEQLKSFIARYNEAHASD